MGVGTRVVAATVLLAALILGLYPHWVLKVPKIGFILHSLLGNDIPPFFDGRIFKYEDKWGRDNDVIIAACTKCGTTWMMQTVNTIRGKGSPLEFNDIFNEVYWAELVYYPGQSMEERIEILKEQQNRYPFSAFKTHKEPPSIVVRANAKYIISIRSPLDIAASLRNFFPSFNIHFAKMWGGFPVEAGKGLSLTAEDFAVYEHMFLENIGNGRPMLDVLAMDMVRGWWPYRKHKNVLFVHYSNRARDHRGQLARISKFLGIEMSVEEFERVVNQTSFASMHEERYKFEVHHVFDRFKARGLVPKEIDSPVKELVAVGPSRSGEKELPTTFLKRVREKIIKDFGADIAKYLFEGGEQVPDLEIP